MNHIKIKFQPFPGKAGKMLKIAVRPDMSGSQFFCLIRSKCQLQPQEALFLFVGTKDEPKVLMNQSQLLSQIWQEWKQDEILHIYYTSENTFGTTLAH